MRDQIDDFEEEIDEEPNLTEMDRQAETRTDPDIDWDNYEEAPEW